MMAELIAPPVTTQRNNRAVTEICKHTCLLYVKVVTGAFCFSSFNFALTWAVGLYQSPWCPAREFGVRTTRKFQFLELLIGNGRAAKLFQRLAPSSNAPPTGRLGVSNLVPLPHGVLAAVVCWLYSPRSEARYGDLDLCRQSARLLFGDALCFRYEISACSSVLMSVNASGASGSNYRYEDVLGQNRLFLWSPCCCLHSQWQKIPTRQLQRKLWRVRTLISDLMYCEKYRPSNPPKTYFSHLTALRSRWRCSRTARMERHVKPS